jgi:hypothetical protein
MNRKVLILAEFFPPYQNTAAYRPLNWFENFSKYKLYPIVFCNDATTQKELNDSVEVTDYGEVHRISYDRSAFDKKIANCKIRVFKIALILWKQFCGPLYSFNAVKKIEPFVFEYLKHNKIDFVIATGGPFALFELANRINLKFGTPWIADYRDHWTTSELTSTNFESLALRVHGVFEKKYTKTCAAVVSVSGYYAQKIGNFVKKPFYTIENGFALLSNIESTKLPGNPKVSFAYVGTLYVAQFSPIAQLINALDILQEKYFSIYNKIKINFVGLSFDLDKAVATLLPQNITKHVNNGVLNLSKFVTKPEALKLQAETDVLLFFTYLNKKTGKQIDGIPSSKLYEYIGFKKPVLTLSERNGIVYDKLFATGQGIFCSNSIEVVTQIIALVNSKIDGSFKAIIDVPENLLIENSRDYQTELYANLVHKLIDGKK